MTTETADLPKCARNRLAKAELWMLIAIQVEAWALRLEGKDRTFLPPDQWPSDDPLVELCRRYDLDPADLARLTRQVAGEVENRSLRAGYDETPMP